MSKKIQSISDITPDPHNLNKGTARGRGMLENSLRKLGAGRSILVDRHGLAIAGNRVLEVAAELELKVKEIETDGTELVVVKRTDLDLLHDTRAKELALADNRVSEVGLAWDAEALQMQGIDLKPWFTEDELKTLGVVVPDFAPVGIDEQGRLDEKKKVTCPECGHEFTPS